MSHDTNINRLQYTYNITIYVYISDTSKNNARHNPRAIHHNRVTISNHVEITSRSLYQPRAIAAPNQVCERRDIKIFKRKKKKGFIISDNLIFEEPETIYKLSLFICTVSPPYIACNFASMRFFCLLLFFHEIIYFLA